MAFDAFKDLRKAQPHYYNWYYSIASLVIVLTLSRGSEKRVASNEERAMWMKNWQR